MTAYEVYFGLAQRLNERAPIDGEKKTLLTKRGAEVVETDSPRLAQAGLPRRSRGA